MAMTALPGAGEHAIPLAGRWGLWRWVCLRGAGFPFSQLDALADPVAAAAADRLLDADATTVDSAGRAFASQFSQAQRRLSRALHVAASDPRFLEAVAWQNRSALESGIGALLRRDPTTVARTARHRRNEALVASYLQRYCAKNDTIGFFGPAGWARIDAQASAIEVRMAVNDTIARRTVYFEGWAIRELARSYADRVRPWLVPRLTPLLDVAMDGWLRLPFAPPIRVSPLVAHTLHRVDGIRTAQQVAAAVLAEPAVAVDEEQVLAILADLHEQRRIIWTLEVAPDDLHPERSLRATLESVTDPTIREPALAALAELVAARDAVAAASRDARPRASGGESGTGERRAALADALAALDATFVRLTGAAPTRRAGQMYAGRTLVYEECLRGEQITFGASILDGVREPLALLLEAARWFTAAGAALLHRACRDIYRRRVAQSGTSVLPLAEFWLLANDLIFRPPADVIASLVRALQQRWAPILALPAETRQVGRRSGDLADAVRAAFAAARPGWAAAVHHSPDLMLCARGPEAILAGEFEWVLGELHPGVNTLRYASRVAYHPHPDDLHHAMRSDLAGGQVVMLAPTHEQGATRARQANGLVPADALWMAFAHDGVCPDPRRALRVGECDVVETDGRLVVHDRSGRHTLDIVEIVADSLSHQLMQHFRIVPPARHTPRVSIDRLVVQREAWTFVPAELTFATLADEAERYLGARRWARVHGLPRHLFARTTGEGKPIFVDLTSLASIALLARAVRRASAHPDPHVSVTEMLPTPDQLWLSDPRGRRYTTELRICAVDQTPR